MISSVDEFVRFDVSVNDINFAKQIRIKRDKIYKNVYKEKETDSRWIGDLGELKVNQALMLCNLEETDWLYETKVAGKCDLIFFGKSIDVKTVKRKVPMKLSYTAQITAKHAKSDVEYLVFACYETETKQVVVLGAMKKEEFLKESTYHGAGHKVHSNYTIRDGHEIYNIEVSKLMPFRDFIMDIRNEKKLEIA